MRPAFAICRFCVTGCLFQINLIEYQGPSGAQVLELRRHRRNSDTFLNSLPQ